MTWPEAFFYSVAVVVGALVVLYTVERISEYKKAKIGR